MGLGSKREIGSREDSQLPGLAKRPFWVHKMGVLLGFVTVHHWGPNRRNHVATFQSHLSRWFPGPDRLAAVQPKSDGLQPTSFHT